jgi:hypothetical protein
MSPILICFTDDPPVFFKERIGQEATVQAGYPRPNHFGARQAQQEKACHPCRAHSRGAYYMK